MRIYSKVRVDFGDESLVDFAQILYNLQSEYEIGFAALSKVEERISLFIQRHGDASCMALNKIRKLCNTVATVVDVTPFNSYTGRIIESYGSFRPRGPRQNGADNEGVTDEVVPHFDAPAAPVTNTRHRGLSKDEELLILGGKAYACREIPLPSNKSTFCAVYGSSNGTWQARFWVGPIECLGVKDRKGVREDQKKALVERQSSLCQECSCPVSIGSYSNADIDHIIPRHLGGKTVLNNLQIICVPCHRTKTGLESKSVRRVFPDLELPSDTDMYAIANFKHDFRDGLLNPLEFMKNPVGVVVMDCPLE